MGCNSSRPEKPCLEIALINGDNSLQYGLHDVWSINSSLKTFLKDGKLGKSELRQYLKTNSLSYDEKAESFYKSLKTGKIFEGNVLATLACLLCKGTVKIKSEVLVDSWGQGGKIGNEEFGKMIHCVFELVIENLPLLASAPTTDNNYTPDELTRFLERAKAGIEKSKQEIIDVLFTTDSCTKSQIQEFFANPNNESWLVPCSIRQRLKAVGKSIRKSRKSGKHAGNSLQDPALNNKVSLTVEPNGEHHDSDHPQEHHGGKIDASE